MIMETCNVESMFKRLPFPSAVVLVTFKRKIDNEVMRALQTLSTLNMDSSLNVKEKLVLMAVLQSRTWDHDQNRTFEITSLKPYALQSFSTSVGPAIEIMKMQGEHRLNALVTGRQRRRQDFASEIIAKILTPPFVTEIESWGVEISHELNLELPLPEISIVVRDGESVIAKVTLDGWSGRIMESDLPIAYSGPEQVWSILQTKAMDYIEAATS